VKKVDILVSVLRSLYRTSKGGIVISSSKKVKSTPRTTSTGGEKKKKGKSCNVARGKKMRTRHLLKVC